MGSVVTDMLAVKSGSTTLTKYPDYLKETMPFHSTCWESSRMRFQLYLSFFFLQTPCPLSFFCPYNFFSNFYIIEKGKGVRNGKWLVRRVKSELEVKINFSFPPFLPPTPSNFTHCSSFSWPYLINIAYCFSLCRLNSLWGLKKKLFYWRV